MVEISSQGPGAPPMGFGPTPPGQFGPLGHFGPPSHHHPHHHHHHHHHHPHHHPHHHHYGAPPHYGGGGPPHHGGGESPHHHGGHHHHHHHPPPFHGAPGEPSPRGPPMARGPPPSFPPFGPDAGLEGNDGAWGGHHHHGPPHFHGYHPHHHHHHHHGPPDFQGHHPPHHHQHGPPHGGGMMGMGPRGPPPFGGMMMGGPHPGGRRGPAPNIEAPASEHTSYPAKAFATNLDGKTSPAIIGADENGSEKELRAKVSLKEDQDTVYVFSNGVPGYQPKNSTGKALTDSWVDVGVSRTGNLDRNPNTIREQDHVFYIPRHPHKDPEGFYKGIYEKAFGGNVMWTPLGAMGVAINGIPLFNEWAGPDKRDAVDAEAFDTCCGHPDPFSQYHYHQLPKCIRGTRALGTDIPADQEPTGEDETGEPVVAATLLKLVEEGGHSPILGHSFDGFPIYGPVGWDGNKTAKIMRSSYKKKEGVGSCCHQNPGDQYVFEEGYGDLDICNGIEGPTPEHPEGIYHYHCTIDPTKLKAGLVEPVYPYILARYRGVPDTRNFPVLGFP